MSSKATLATAVIEYASGFKRRFINAPVSTDFKYSIINLRFGNRRLDLSDCFEMTQTQPPEFDGYIYGVKFVAPENLRFMNIPARRGAIKVDNILLQTNQHGRSALINAQINQLKSVIINKQKLIVLAYLMRYANDGGMNLIYSDFDNFDMTDIRK